MSEKQHSSVLLNLILKYKKYAIIITLISVISIVISYVSPLINAKLIDVGILGKQVPKLLLFLVSLSVIRLIDFIFEYINSLCTLTFNYKLKKDISNRLIDYMINKKETRTGEADKLLREEVSNFIMFFTSNVPQLVFSIIKVLFAVIMMFYIQWSVALVVIVIEVITFIASCHFNNKVSEQGENLRKLLISQIIKMSEIVDNIFLVKHIHARDYVMHRYNNAMHVTYKENCGLNKLSQSLLAIQELAQNLIELIIWGIGGCFVIKENITLGVLYSLLMYVGYFHGSLRTVLATWKGYCENKVSLHVILTCLKEIEMDNSTSELSITGIREINVSDVSFGYDEKTLFTNTDISFTSEKPNYIIGHSGVGKTTFMRMLIGALECSSGYIEFRGERGGSISSSKARGEYVSWVPQEPIMFNDTIMNNLTLGKQKTIDEVIYVCKQCAIDQYINDLPHKYDTVVDENGQNLSTGQKQRICLARAILQNLQIICIDEMTSSLDPETKEFVNLHIANIVKDKIIIIISHDVEYIPVNAHIYEIKDKKIVKKC